MRFILRTSLVIASLVSGSALSIPTAPARQPQLQAEGPAKFVKGAQHDAVQAKEEDGGNRRSLFFHWVADQLGVDGGKGSGSANPADAVSDAIDYSLHPFYAGAERLSDAAIEAYNRGMGIAQQGSQIVTDAATTGYRYGSSGYEAARNAANQGANYAQQYGSQGVNQLQNYGSQAVDYTKQGVNQGIASAEHYGGLAAHYAANYGGQALNHANSISRQGLSYVPGGNRAADLAQAWMNKLGNEALGQLQDQAQHVGNMARGFGNQVLAGEVPNGNDAFAAFAAHVAAAQHARERRECAARGGC